MPCSVLSSVIRTAPRKWLRRTAWCGVERKIGQEGFFDIAYNYYRLEEYNSAMIAFTNALDDPRTTERKT